VDEISRHSSYDLALSLARLMGSNASWTFALSSLSNADQVIGRLSVPRTLPTTSRTSASHVVFLYLD
ncbi:MAG: hypothetical protein SGPRY_009998, partial [Prymnesium sp.]